MSSTNRGAPRRAADFYPTPDAAVVACVRTLEIGPGAQILDPSVGNAAWPMALHEVYGTTGVDCVDLYPERYPGLAYAIEHKIANLVHRGRFQRFDRPNSYDFVITNPPYAIAAEFLVQAMFVIRPGGRVGYLLRHGFPATAGRSELTRRYPPRWDYLLQTRPSYTDDGKTDSVEYSFYVWEKGWTGRTGEDYLEWDDKDGARAAACFADVQRIRSRDWTYGVSGVAAYLPPRT